MWNLKIILQQMLERSNKNTAVRDEFSSISRSAANWQQLFLLTSLCISSRGSLVQAAGGKSHQTEKNVAA
jgi:hypothetical protein